MTDPANPLQGNLFAQGAPKLSREADIARRDLDEECWVDHARGWVSGGDTLFDQLRSSLAWERKERPMYDKIVAVPRLTCSVALDDPAAPALLEEMASRLRARYHATFDRAFVAHYRDGRDSVAWHGDRVRRDRRNHHTAIVSLGGPRRLMLRPKGGGASISYTLESGDLLVLGGAIHHHWEHCVPKVAYAPPRIAVLFFAHDDEIDEAGAAATTSDR